MPNPRKHLDAIEAAQRACVQIQRLPIDPYHSYLTGRLCAQAEAAQMALITLEIAVREHWPRRPRDYSHVR
jgi:hypothetical protein